MASPADDDALRRHAALLEVLARQHGLANLALGAAPGELVADVASGRTYFDVIAFELDVLDVTGCDTHVTPSGAPGASVRERLTHTPAA